MVQHHDIFKRSFQQHANLFVFLSCSLNSGAEMVVPHATMSWRGRM